MRTGNVQLNNSRVGEIQWAQFNKKIETFFNIILELHDSSSVINNLLTKFGQRLGAQRDIARGIITYLNDKSMDKTRKKINLIKDLKFIFRKLTSEEKEGFLKYLDPKKKFNCSLDELSTILNKTQKLHGKVLFQSKTGDMLLLDPDYFAECFLMGKLDLQNSTVLGRQVSRELPTSSDDGDRRVFSSTLLKVSKSPTASQTKRRLALRMWSHGFGINGSSSSSSSDHFLRRNPIRN